MEDTKGFNYEDNYFQQCSAHSCVHSFEAMIKGCRYNFSLTTIRGGWIHFTVTISLEAVTIYGGNARLSQSLDK